MILADKIIRLRKKNGWSQEELADKVNVSRQAVSKWESAQAIPDLEKILLLGAVFGVTTDYLLKDEIENEEFTDDLQGLDVKKISIEEANVYIEQRKRSMVHCYCYALMRYFSYNAYRFKHVVGAAQFCRVGVNRGSGGVDCYICIDFMRRSYVYLLWI